ncbi:MAG: ComEC/Rec2 family competence protein [Terriglobia bacterium]
MKSPLLVLASSFSFGILLARLVDSGTAGIPLTFLAACGCLLSGLLALRLGWRTASSILALAGFVAAGGLAAQLFEQRFPPNHISRLTGFGIDLEDPVRLAGRLSSNATRTADGYQFDLSVDSLESRGRARSLTGKVRLRLQTSDDPETLALAESLRLRYGDRIRVLVKLRRPRIYQNPGSFDFRRWMESVEDIAYVGAIKDPRLVERLESGESPNLSLVFQRARKRLLEGIDRMYPPWSAEGKTGAVLKAVLLGDRSALDSEVIENFRKTGLYHLLVISGLHVGLLAMIAGAILRRTRLREAWRAGILLSLLLVYAGLVEQRAPTLRATLMITGYLLGRFLYREHSLLNAVGLAGLILLVYRPAWLFESGFQLSFAAALIIAALAVPILQRTTEPLRRAFWQLQDPDRDINIPARIAQIRLDVRRAVTALKSRIPFLDRHPTMAMAVVTGPLRLALWAAGLLIFSAVLQLGLLLPMAETFHRVTYAGIGLNALAIPLMTLLLGLAVPVVLLGAVSPWLAAWPGKILALIMHGLFALTDLPAMPAWLSYRIPEPPLWVSLGFAFLIVASAWTLGRHRRAFWISLTGLAVMGGLISWHPFPPRLPKGAIEVTVLDCGGGDAIFLVLPDRTTMLVDAGGSRMGSGREGAFRTRRWDPGEDIISPYLWSRGIKKVDIVALSHAHSDHLGGLPAVIRNFQIGEFWHSPTPSVAAFDALRNQMARQRIPARQKVAGDRNPLGGALVEVLWPPGNRPLAAGPANDDSLVMRVSAGEAGVLLTGDISREVEQELLRSGVRLESRVLKVAHHGARGSSGAEFLARVGASVALIGSEGGTDASLPSLETLGRLKAAGLQPMQTDLQGAITVSMSRSRMATHVYGQAGE